MTPVFEDYLKKNDLSGYMKALWQGYAEGDKESLHALLYLAVQTSNAEDALDIAEKLLDVDQDYVILFDKHLKEEMGKLSEEEQNDETTVCNAVKMAYLTTDMALRSKEESYFYRFGEAQNTLFRGYINDAGKPQPEAKLPTEDPQEEPVEVPEDTLDYWKSYLSRTDAATTQNSIYQSAIPYAEKGHPYAMYIVGFMLYYGIKTKYSSPSMVYLEPDNEKALPWLQRAADKDIPNACWLTYYIYMMRFRKTKQAEDEQLALSYLDKGAALGNSNCIEELQKIAEEHGEDRKAFEHLKKLAETDRSAKLKLAKYYEQGKGCEKDLKKAFELVEYVYNHSSATPYNSDWEDSAEMLADYYYEGIGCEKNVDKYFEIKQKLREDNEYLDYIMSK